MLVINPSVRRQRVIVVGLCVWLSNLYQYMILLAIVFMCDFQHFTNCVKMHIKDLNWQILLTQYFNILYVTTYM